MSTTTTTTKYELRPGLTGTLLRHQPHWISSPEKAIDCQSSKVPSLKSTRADTLSPSECRYEPKNHDYRTNRLLSPEHRLAVSRH